jgi:hypothetical protein
MSRTGLTRIASRRTAYPHTPDRTVRHSLAVAYPLVRRMSCTNRSSRAVVSS